MCSRHAKTGSDPFVSARSAEVPIPKALPYEKSVEVTRRALSATLNWGKHRLAQEPGLFRDVFVSWVNVTEILLFFQ